MNRENDYIAFVKKLLHVLFLFFLSLKKYVNNIYISYKSPTHKYRKLAGIKIFLLQE